MKKTVSGILSFVMLAGYFLSPSAADAAIPSFLTCGTPNKDGAAPALSGIINTYYAGTGAPAAGSNTITLGSLNPNGSPIALSPGDMAFIVQIQDSTINSTNTSSYGSGAGIASGYISTNAGKYEYVKITKAIGSTITFAGTGTGGGLVNSYVEGVADGTTTGQKTFEVVRIPQYSSVTLAGQINPAKWNGQSGGIAAIDVSGNLNLNGNNIDATGAGFRGAGVIVLRGVGTGRRKDVVTPFNGLANGSKGEGTAGTPNYVLTVNGGTTTVTATSLTIDGYPNGSSANGAPANAGGGGTDANPPANDQNPGGGGGGNGGFGGKGGFSWSTGLDVGGRGGSPAPAINAIPGALYLFGGGGGAGTSNDGTTAAPATANGSSGGAGGGIVIVRSGSGLGSGNISAAGTMGIEPINDGGGGGGAGGTTSVTTINPVGPGFQQSANGANGTSANLSSTGAGNNHGPGGGGGGGIYLTSNGSGSTNAGYSAGFAGITSDGTSFGATSGVNGQFLAENPPDVVGIASGAECLGLPNPFFIGPLSNPSATGSYDGVVVATNNNDFTAFNIEPKNTSVTTNPNGTGVPVSSVITNASPCVGHTYNNVTAGNQSFSISVTAPTGMLVGLYSDSACTVLVSGTTVGSLSTGVVNANLAQGSSGIVYTQYTATTAKTFTPYVNTDVLISYYITGNPTTNNNTHDELYFGFVSVTKTTSILSSPCNVGTSTIGACPGSVIGYTLTYRNTVLGAASETTLTPIPLATATGLIISDDGSASGSFTNNWFTNSKIGLNAVPIDTISGTTYTYTGTLGTNASKFNAMVGGPGFKLVPVGFIGAGTGSSGSITFNTTLK